jgi:hypothetical protein
VGKRILTDFVRDIFVGHGAGSGFTKQDDAPFPAVSELETFVVYLVCEFAGGGDDECSYAGRWVVAAWTGGGCGESGENGKEIGESFSGASGRDSCEVTRLRVGVVRTERMMEGWETCLEKDWDAVRLYAGGMEVSVLGEVGHQKRGEAELLERVCVLRDV